MDLPLYIVVFTIISFLRNASAHCWLTNLDIQETGDCTFNIDCEGDIEFIDTPLCHIKDASLQIRNTTVETFSKDFYNGTNFDDYIISVKATGNNWTRLSPRAFSFNFCTRIDLSNNGIKFIHKNAFQRLPFLTELNLSRNAIEELDIHSFTDSDVLLRPIYNNLTVLDLSHNSLSYIPNGSLHHLPELQRLYLDCNMLVFLSDGAFMDMNNLIVLSLSYNQLTSLHTTLEGLNQLEELYLSFNKLNHLHDYELTDVISLKTVNMSHNSLETVDFNAFNFTTNLQMLDLSNNKIRSPISIFNKTKLKYLNVCHNRIAIVDTVFASSTNHLETVDFSLNDISVIPAGLFASAENLNLLNVSSNLLSNLSDNSLLGLKNVTVLDLSKNELLELNASSFKECNNLNELVLDFNLIKNIDFDQLTALVPTLSILSIGSNQIQCKDVSEYYTKGLKKGVNVTSINKVFDDDNIFGIACDALKSVKKESFFTETLTWTLLMVLIIIMFMISGVWSAVTNRPKSPPTIALTNFSDDVMEMNETEQQSNL